MYVMCHASIVSVLLLQATTSTTLLRRTNLQKVNRMLQQGDIVQRAEHQRPFFAFAPVVDAAAAIVGFERDGMPGVVEGGGDEDCLEGLFVFVVGLLFAHGCFE